ncbi:MAG: hypothetical protein ABR907_10405 [Terracidiphilus sp.]|jgi:hypothetical protein
MFQRPRILLPTNVILAITVLLCIVNSSSKANSQQLKAEDAEKFQSQIFHGEQVPSIPEYLSKTTGDFTVTSDADREGLLAFGINAPAYPPEWLVDLSCDADAVVIATPVKGVSHMTSDHMFIYSDWTMHIQSVLQDTPKAPLGNSEMIVVVRPGGKLYINGRTVNGVAWDFPEFQPDAEYLLFLTYIPQTGAFAVRTRRAFNLSFDPRKIDKSHQYKRGESRSPEEGQYALANSASPDELVINARAAIAYAAGKTTCKKEGNQ